MGRTGIFKALKIGFLCLILISTASATTIDDFEEGDLSEYSVSSTDCGIVSSGVYECI